MFFVSKAVTSRGREQSTSEPGDYEMCPSSLRQEKCRKDSLPKKSVPFLLLGKLYRSQNGMTVQRSGKVQVLGMDLPYFRMNLSTRPSESTNFCFPVKNG
jgi:hypothetical protein